MANKRMFSNSVIDSDAFCLLSTEAQLLYFHLGMKADDDGFVPVMKICKILGFNGDPLRELEESNFIISFDGGVVAIVHFEVNNTLKKDRYHESRYTSFKRQLKKNENNEYVLMEPERNQDGTKAEDSKAQPNVTQPSVIKPSVTNGSTGEGSPEGGGESDKRNTEELSLLLAAVERQGIKLSTTVRQRVRDELERSSYDEVMHKLMTKPSFMQYLKFANTIDSEEALPFE